MSGSGLINETRFTNNEQFSRLIKTRRALGRLDESITANH
uniref:Uncharacterized protein n=1 Tax=Anguilla anguilla TaxID=7936 RepID=A0A0E9SY65_ANGAN